MTKILNSKVLEKINSTFNKAHNLECSDCDMQDHGCFCEQYWDEDEQI